MTPRELLEEIRTGLTAPEWSAAVSAARKGEVALHERRGEVYFFDVVMGRRLPWRVELDLGTGEWACTCDSRRDACGHVAAAAITLSQGRTGALAAPVATRGPHLRHVLKTEGRGLVWSGLTVGEDPARLPQPLVGPPPEELVLSPGDREVLALTMQPLTSERIQPLLRALAMCEDVEVAGLRVKVTHVPVVPVLVVEDHPRGIVVQLAPREVLHMALGNLVVVGDPPTLRPLAPSTLSREDAELFRRPRPLAGDEATRFLSEALPRLRERTLVEMRTRKQSTVSRPWPRLRFAPAEGGFEVMASINYGRPPQAVVVGDKLHLLSGSTEAPVRVPEDERKLQGEFEALGLVAGRRLTLTGMDAARFVSQVLPRFRGVVSNREVAERMKIREATLHARWEIDTTTGEPALTFALDAAEGGGRASLEGVVGAWRQGGGLVPMLDGGFARLPADWMERWGHVVEALLMARGDPPPVKAALLMTLLPSADAHEDAERIKQAVTARASIPPAEPPPGLRASLRPYQRDGLAWLVHLERSGYGGILADDMGLGKTVQTLALILSDPPEVGPTLVVAPRSVLDNWQAEARRFAPELAVTVYHGPGRSLPTNRRGLVVTTYALMRQDRDLLAQLPWRRIVLDEAQAIKNAQSQAAQAARSLPAPHRLALTGTPVENRLGELWSIMEFTTPGLLGDRARFEDTWSNSALTDPRAVRALRARVQPFILRRLKQVVAPDLPPKTEVMLKAHLSAAERKIYEAVRTAGLAEVRKLVALKGLAASRLSVLEVLLRMRQACCHPRLVPGAAAEAPAESAKVRLLLDQLEIVVAEGHKALVFSQWTSLLDLVGQALTEAELAFVRLDGSTRDRGEVVARFQAEGGPGVFLISLKAGGTGLNLTAADYVYLLDPWWNPAVEEQAIDRAYRIGQDKPVVATRLIAADTVEERVVALQAGKRSLADAALGGEADWVGSLSEQDIADLLTA